MVLIDDLYHNLPTPSLVHKLASHQLLFTTASLCRFFLTLCNNTTAHNLPSFLSLLESRKDASQRTRGLLTVSNHISVMDDPLIWGVLPLTTHFTTLYTSHRWTPASHDLCFINPLLAHFFTLGQLLPTHRIKHSPHGGLFQPSVTEAIRLLSPISTSRVSWSPHARTVPSPPSSWPRDVIDPFSPVTPAPSFPSYKNDVRSYLAPSRYASNNFGWVHIFPEGFVHQTDPSERTCRYFKWGVSRLILEPEICPDVVPMFIEGTDQIMHESRTFPRFLPRVGKEVHVSFGDVVDGEKVFGDLRRRWRAILTAEYERERDERKKVTAHGRQLLVADNADGEASDPGWDALRIGIVPERLKHDPEVVELRMECTRRVREEVLKVRRGRGYPDEDPKFGVAQTWKLEGGEREGEKKDGSWVKEA